MSNSLFVKRKGNGDLQFCGPRAYEWAIADVRRHSGPRHSPSHAPPKLHQAPLHPQQVKTHKRWSPGPWQHARLCPPTIPSRSNRLHKHVPLVDRHTDPPFCSIVFHEGPLPAKLKAKASAFDPPQLDKQKAHTLDEKAKMKARFSTVLPVVALSKNGKWVPPALGRKAHARLARHSGGGWSRRRVPIFDGAQIETEAAVDSGIIGNERQHFSFDRPELNSSALLLHKLYVAEEELKHAHKSTRRALLQLGCDGTGLSNMEHQYATGGLNGARFQHDGKGTQHHNGAPNESEKQHRFSVRASCFGRRKRNL